MNITVKETQDSVIGQTWEVFYDGKKFGEVTLEGNDPVEINGRSLGRNIKAIREAIQKADKSEEDSDEYVDYRSLPLSDEIESLPDVA